MLKRLLTLTLLLASFAGAQYKDVFTGPAATFSARDKWVQPTGTAAASNGFLALDGSGNAMPQHASGAINYGYGLYDSLLAIGSGKEAYVIFAQKGGTDNARYFGLGVSPTKDWTTGTGLGHFAGFQEMTTSGGVDRTNLKLMTGTMATLGGTNPTDFAASGTRYIAKEFTAGDTIGITVWPASGGTGVRVTMWYAAVGAGRDSTFNGSTTVFTTTLPAGTEAAYSGGLYFWIGGAVLSTPFKVTEFGIRNAGTAPAPPAATDNAAPDASFNLSTASPYLGDAVTVSVSATDDSAMNQSIVEVDTGTGGYHTITTNTWAGTTTSGSFTSASFTRYVAGNATVRVRTSDHNKNNAAIRWDTTTTQVATFTARPAVNNNAQKRFGWITFQGNIRWPAPYSGGTIPHDSIPWSMLTHVGFFAANGTNPLNQAGYIAEYPYFFARAHQANVYAGITVGGSGDAALVTLMQNPATWASWIATYMGFLDNGAGENGDFIDFDLEGSYNVAQIGAFFAQLKDSMNVAWRSSGMDPTRKPFIVLTVSVPRAESWRASLEQYCEFVNVMSYDYAANDDTWERLIWDNQPRSRTNANGTGTIIDTYNAAGTANDEAPSMQKMAARVIAAGWPASKVNIGLDVMPAWYGSSNTTVGARGPLYMRQPTASIPGLTANGSSPTFTSLWPLISVVPSDSIFFDQNAQAYSWHTGSAAAGGAATTDRVYGAVWLPGRDSGLIYTRKVIDSMGIGLCIWNLGTEVWRTAAPIPPGGSGAFFSALKTVFSSAQDSTPVKLAPPTHVSPANAATGVAVNPTLDWSDVSGSTEFWVQVATSSAFTSPTVSDSNFTISQRAVSGLANNTTYYWRVATQNANGFGQFSVPTTFTTIPVTPSVPVLNLPANAATGQPATISLSWNAAANAATYQVQVDSLDNGFTHLVVDASGITGLTYQASLTNNKTYYWRVRSTNAAGSSAYTTARSFTTIAGKPGFATLSAPSNGAGAQDTNALLFSWGAGSGATSYRFKISTSPALTSPFKDTVVLGTSTSVWGLTGSTVYFWSVNSYNASDSSGYGGTFTFTTTGQAQTQYPGAIGPWPLTMGADGKIDVSQPPLFIALKEGAASGADQPSPPNETYSYFSLAGIKRAGGTFTAWSDIGGGGVSAGDTIVGVRIERGVIAESLMITGRVQNDTSQKSSVLIVPNTTTQGTVTLTAPTHPGTIVTETGSDIDANTFTSVVPVDQPSGGFGTNPAAALGLGYANAVWVYLQGASEWALLPMTDFLAAFKVVSWNSVTSGAKIPILTSAGTTMLDTTGLFASGSGTLLSDATEDTMKSWVHARNSTTPDTAGIRFYSHDATGAHMGSIYGDATYLNIRAANSTNGQIAIGGADGSDRIQFVPNNGAEHISSASGRRTVRHRTTTTNSDPFDDVIKWRSATTNNTATVVAQLSLDSSMTNISDYSADGSTYLIRWTVIASRTDADGYAKYERVITYRNNAGTVTEVGEDVIGADIESNANTACTFAVSGDYAQVTWTGDTSQNWTVHIHAVVMGVNN